jgi:hypothetical protein
LKPFTFYDGPPFATGLPHYGHMCAGTIKVFRNIFRILFVDMPVKQDIMFKEDLGGIVMVFQLNMKLIKNLI